MKALEVEVRAGQVPRKAEDPRHPLGLAIAKNLVNDYGGTVTIENARGGGARVTISLPEEPNVLAT